MNMQSRIRCLALALALAAIGAASAQVVNGSFEQNGNYSTTLNGWTTYGNHAVQTVDTFEFDDPTNGTYQALLASNTDATAHGLQDGNGLPLAHTATSSFDAEDFLGVDHGSLDGVGNGSVVRTGAMKQTLHLKVGDKVAFDYQMLTFELYKSHDGSNSGFDQRPSDTSDDFGFFSVSGGGVKSLTKLVDVFYGYQNTGLGQSDFNTGFSETPFDNNSNTGDFFYMQTPHLQYSFTAMAEADYTIGFGATDAFKAGGEAGGGVSSALAVDNVKLIAAPVPEPASMLALGLGLAAMRRRRKRA